VDRLKLFCLHETGTGAVVWSGLEEEIGARAAVVAHERLGWREDTPEEYRATTINEQAEDAAKALTSLGEPTVLCGAGLGAVVALQLLARHPALISAALLIEPPLLAFVPAATEGLSADRVALEQALREGGPSAGAALYLSGELEAIGPGVRRLPEGLTAAGRERPISLFAELGAVPGWSMPLPALRANERPVSIVVSEGTPPLVREASAALAEHLGAAESHVLPGAGPAHVDAAPALAEMVLSRAGE
jgi:pimeloyl-ACP methyl ester carboxylesterase